jgi:hypothetical protein
MEVVMSKRSDLAQRIVIEAVWLITFPAAMACLALAFGRKAV